MSSAKLSDKTPDVTVDGSTPETFDWLLANGDVAVVGKPPGVLRMKIYGLLDSEMRQDLELANIATAFLSIRTIGGRPLILRTYNEFLALMERFGSDDNLDKFLREYQKLTNPEVTQLIEEAITEGLERKLKPNELKELMGERMMAYEAENRGRVKA